MFASLVSVPALLLALTSSAAAKSVSATPHDKYSSSVGVLGCKINTNRVAYWPGSIDCDNICVKLTYEGRSVNLLRIDQSGGAYDISYDAWAYLQTGKSATDKPITGGGVAMEYEEVDASECADLIYTKGSKLPLSASNSINYLTSCLDQPNSWVAKNHVLYNICDAICTLGYDETCKLDLSTSNQPSCPHTLGLQDELTSAPVYDIAYESGDTVNAGTGEVGDASDVEAPEQPEESAPEPTAESEPTSTVESASSSDQGGVFFESASATPSIEQSTDEPVPESSTVDAPEVVVPTEIPATSEAPIETPTEVPVIPSTTPLTTLVTATSTPKISTSVVSSTAHVSPSHSTPSSSPTSTPPPESAAHSIVHVPFLLLVSSVLMCLIIS